MFDVSTLINYVDEKSLGLLSRAVLGAKSLGLINVQTGVKYKSAINILEVSPVIQEGGCGFDPEGNAKFTQREIEAPLLKVNMEFCEKDLITKWMNYQVRVAAGFETLPFEEKIMNDIIANVNAQVEDMIWSGDSALGVKGILDYTAEFGTATKGATVKESIEAAYMAIPAEVLGKAKIFVGEDVYRSYTKELVDANMFHYDGKYGEGRIVIPGTNVEVVAVAGLDGANAIIAADPANLYWGVDMQNDQEKFRFWYSDDNQIFRLAINFNGGAQVAFPDEVVYVAL